MAEFSLSGMSSMRGKLKAVGVKTKGRSRAAMRDEGKDILAGSQRRVPRDKSNLAATGKYRDTQLKGINIGVEITYGGPGSPQALAIHETPPSEHHPRSWQGVTSINFTTPGTGHKYLEKPLREAGGGMAGRIGVKVKL